ncbi:hypothetical protein RUND412_010372 [Rhizina undulata]
MCSVGTLSTQDSATLSLVRLLCSANSLEFGPIGGGHLTVVLARSTAGQATSAAWHCKGGRRRSRGIASQASVFRRDRVNGDRWRYLILGNAGFSAAGVEMQRGGVVDIGTLDTRSN